MPRLATMTAVLWLATGCAHSSATTTAARTGRLFVKCCARLESGCHKPDESRVTIDGAFAGRCAEWEQGRVVTAGRHHIEIEAADLSPHSEDVVVPEDGQSTVQMSYDPMPD